MPSEATVPVGLFIFNQLLIFYKNDTLLLVSISFLIFEVKHEVRPLVREL